jgi:hypothetical protein
MLDVRPTANIVTGIVTELTNLEPRKLRLRPREGGDGVFVCGSFESRHSSSPSSWWERQTSLVRTLLIESDV